MENEAHLICEEDFKPENLDDNKEIPAIEEFRSGYLKWMAVSRVAIDWNKKPIGSRFWNKRPTPEQRSKTPWPDSWFDKCGSVVNLDDYMNTLPDPQTLREKILSWFSDTSDRVKIWANTKFSDNYINNTLLKGHNHDE